MKCVQITSHEHSTQSQKFIINFCGLGSCTNIWSNRSIDADWINISLNKWSSLNTIVNQCCSEIKRYVSPGQIHVTGHSIGCFVAAHCIPALENVGFSVKNVLLLCPLGPSTRRLLLNNKSLHYLTSCCLQSISKSDNQLLRIFSQYYKIQRNVLPNPYPYLRHWKRNVNIVGLVFDPITTFSMVRQIASDCRVEPKWVLSSSHWGYGVEQSELNDYLSNIPNCKVSRFKSFSFMKQSIPVHLRDFGDKKNALTQKTKHLFRFVLTESQ